MPIIYYPSDALVYRRTVSGSNLIEETIGSSPHATFVFSGSNFTSASYIASTSYASFATSASYAPGNPSLSASYAFTASYALNGGSGGTSLTTGSTYPITASWSTNVVNAPLVTGTMVTGSTYPITAFTASYWNSGSIVSLIGTKQNAIATGSTLPVTSSWASNVVNAPLVTGTMVTGSTYPITTFTASFWNSSSVITLIGTKQNTISTGSTLPVTSSWASNVVNAPLVTGTMVTGSTYPITAFTASFWNSSSVVTLIGTKQNNLATGSTLPITASVAITASYALNGGGSGGGLATGSTYPITSSWAVSSLTSSYISSSFSKGGTFYSPSGITGSANIVIWRAPINCRVTTIWGYRTGGSSALINARKNGTGTIATGSHVNLTSTDTWMSASSIITSSFTTGDALEMMVITSSGAPTQLAVQIDFTN